MRSFFGMPLPVTAASLVSTPSNGLSQTAVEDPEYTSQVIYVGPTLATLMLETMAYERQRKIRTEHVALLARELARGTFKPCTIEINVFDGRQYLIDGYHRLWAILESGIGSPMVLVTRVVGSMAEVDANYAVIDTGLVRTSVDRAKAHDLTTRFDLTKKQVTALGSAVSVIAGGFEFAPQEPRVRDVVRADSVRIPTMEAWLPEMRHLIAILDGVKSGYSRTNQRKIKAAGALAIVLVTLRHQPELAEQFWSAVIDNDGLRHEQPERVLTDFLAEARVQALGQRLFTRSIARCWNAYIDGRALSFAVMRKNDSLLHEPILLKGTPYDGKRVVRDSYGDQELAR